MLCIRIEVYTPVVPNYALSQLALYRLRRPYELIVLRSYKLRVRGPKVLTVAHAACRQAGHQERLYGSWRCSAAALAFVAPTDALYAGRQNRM